MSSTAYVGQIANPGNAIAIPILTVIGVLLTYLPFRSFYRVKNFSACSIVIISNITAIFCFLGAVIWPNDDQQNWWLGYGLCDIEALLWYPITTALGCSLCSLVKGLAGALDTDNARFNPTRAMKRRKLIGEICFCWLPCVLMIATQYLVQAGRYGILPVIGCATQLDNSWPSILVSYIWMPIFAVLTGYYALLLLYRLHKHRKFITESLNTTGSGLNSRKFIKLSLISLSIVFIYLPVQVFMSFRSFPTTWVAYSYTAIHDQKLYNPILLYHTGDAPLLQYNGWSPICMSVFLFMFFGFNDESIDTYRKWMVSLGLGRIWPSLKEPRDARRRGSDSVGSTFSDHFDVVGKVIKYFDGGARNKSVDGASSIGTNTLAGPGSSVGGLGPGGQSRKISQAGLSHIQLTSTTTTSSIQKQGIPAPASLEFSHNEDVITIYPAPLNSSHLELSPFPPTTPVPTLFRSHTNHGFFSMFRTNFHLPDNLFHQKYAPDQPADLPLKFQRSGDAETHAHVPVLGAAPTTVSTQIWSSTPSSTQQNGTGPAFDHNPGSRPSFEYLHVDTMSPKLGSRAYRERERREFQDAKIEKGQARVVSSRAEDDLELGVLE